MKKTVSKATSKITGYSLLWSRSQLLWVLVMLFANGVAAEEIDGAKILELEAKRAQELKRLEHEALVAERQARIAKAMKELKAAGGYLPPTLADAVAANIDGSLSNSRAEESASVKPIPNKESFSSSQEEFDIPRVKSISGKQAILESKKYGTLVAKAGSRLPDEFTVVAVDEQRGVTLQRHGVAYLTQIQW